MDKKEALLLDKVVEKIGGEAAVKIVNELKKREKTTEEELVKSTGVKLTEVRKILFKLHNFSIVSSETVQDKNTGWMTFYWVLQKDQLKSLIRTQKKRTLEKLKARLEIEKTHDFFYCESGHGRFTFEEAMENIFKCPACSTSLKHFDNLKIVEALEKKVKELEEELEHE